MDYLSNRIYLGGIDDEQIGGLLLLLGANNEGKSNVLAGINALANNQSISEKDKPNYIDCEEKIPQISIEYRIQQKDIKQRDNKKGDNFAGKTFGIVFIPNCIDDCKRRNAGFTNEDCKSFWQSILDSRIEAFYRSIGNNELPDILLISKEKKCIFFIGIDSFKECPKSLKCYQVYYQNKFNEIKNNDGVIKLSCKFRAHLDAKTPKHCDDANELREFLKKEYEKSINIQSTKIANKKSQYEIFSATKVFGEKGLEYSQNLLDTENQFVDVVLHSFQIPFIPKIIMYQEKPLKDKDLEISLEQLRDSIFFQALFKILDEKIESIIKICKDSRNKRQSKEKELEKTCQKISERFNVLYCLDNKTYRFNIRLEQGSIAFCMEKDDKAIYLDQQSVGFKKFFHFFFNFLYTEEVSKGDIVLIDEVDAHLSILAQRELRKFLKEFGQENGILFIVSTHSPFMIDTTELDEIRIVKSLERYKKGVGILNDFSVLKQGEADTLQAIKKALGASIDIEDRLIFVEGIIDYNILNAYSKIYKYPKDSTKLVFLPISGLGECKDGEKGFSKEQEQKVKNLITFARQSKILNPILLTDGDKAGMMMKEGVEKHDEFKKNINILTLQDVYSGNKDFTQLLKDKNLTIESLFNKEDKEKFFFTYNQDSKDSSPSRLFKRTRNLELSSESKKNFDALFTFLIECNTMLEKD
ncbi:hypothetical protein CQA53_09485 [Helicobacter didelphidarum]|uniref:Endonuclease GajA/Old nuclease/RecF-like AAA domain-containing protein n=1 Tax=Helicobacter didelphidarum TaxID=2040648 RepID=A0A3D8IAS1_9HELI|nr:hypothetical protein CQA53_09485 [Helicobacter didelphidarum]